jgi:outer membrane receptor protein involved in Fe transport
MGVALQSRARPSILAAANAVPSPLDPVVVIGSRVEYGSFDLPGAVDVVDAGRIGAENAQVDASEALAAVPGIAIQNRQNYATGWLGSAPTIRTEGRQGQYHLRSTSFSCSNSSAESGRRR